MDYEIKELLDNGFLPEEVAIIMEADLDHVMMIFEEMYA